MSDEKSQTYYQLSKEINACRRYVGDAKSDYYDLINHLDVVLAGSANPASSKVVRQLQQIVQKLNQVSSKLASFQSAIVQERN